MTRILLLFVLILQTCFAEYSQYQLDAFKNVSIQCIRKLGIPEDSDILERVKYNKNVTENTLTKEYILCGQKLLGWIDSDGNFQKETIIDFFSDRYDADMVKDVIELCTASTGKSVPDKVYNFYQCYFKHKKYAL